MCEEIYSKNFFASFLKSFFLELSMGMRFDYDIVLVLGLF